MIKLFEDGLLSLIWRPLSLRPISIPQRQSIVPLEPARQLATPMASCRTRESRHVSSRHERDSSAPHLRRTEKCAFAQSADAVSTVCCALRKSVDCWCRCCVFCVLTQSSIDATMILIIMMTGDDGLVMIRRHEGVKQPHASHPVEKSPGHATF